MKREVFASQVQARNLRGNGKARLVWDRAGRFLAVRVTSRGTRTYVVVRKVGGRAVYHRIGPVDAISLKKAQELAEVYNGQVASNAGLPVAERITKITWGTFWDTAYEPYCRQHHRSIASKRSIWKRHVDGLKSHVMSETTARELSALHLRIGETVGHRTANIVRTLLCSMFTLATELGHVPPDYNPARRVKRFGDCEGCQARRRTYVKPADMGRLMEAIMQDRPIYRDFFSMALATGARRSSIASMRWRDINLANGVWTIPSQYSKNKLPVDVKLGTAALTILARRPQDGEWVFPRTGRPRCGSNSPGHLIEVSQAWRRICKRAGLTAGREGYIVHDLRRTVGVYAAGAGANQRAIQAMLGHRDIGSTEIYTELGQDLALAAAAKGFDAVRGQIFGDLDLKALPAPARSARKHDSVGGVPGCLERGRNRVTRTTVSLIDGEVTGFDLSDGRWFTTCDAHDTAAVHETRKAAKRVLYHPEVWCDACRDAHARAGT